MRTRLLANEAALADYEILEMLLFLGVPRRDTKPLAKAMVNSFGSLAASVAAPVDALARFGLPAKAVQALALVGESAEQLGRPETRAAVLLDGWAPLVAHIDPVGRSTAPPALEALLLDTRNRLVAQPRWPAEAVAADVVRPLLAEALERHASAVILVRHRAGAKPKMLPADRALHAAVKGAAAPLSVVVHDLVVVGQGRWTSLRQSGLG